MQASAICRSFRRTAIRIRAGSRETRPFPDPATLFVKPDHYVTRMLYSQGVTLEELGIPRKDGKPVESDPRQVWRRFAERYHLFRGTPTRAWLDHAFATLFDLDERLSAKNADALFRPDRASAWRRREFLPRALFERFNIEAIATTESPLDDLRWHKMIRESGWSGRVITAYRPDPVVDPEFDGFAANLERFGEIAGEDVGSFEGYLRAHRKRRAFFASMGATSTDHGHPSARTADLPPPRRKRFTPRCAKADRARPKPRCSAPRCSPRWRR